MSNFLEQIKRGLAVSATPHAPVRTRSVIDRNPVTADLRIFANGAIYPSASLVKRFNLEYQYDDTDNKTNGFDVVDSREFANTATSAQPFLMVYSVPKNMPKVDLFSNVRYNDGKPLSSVMTQGTNTFGKQLLELLKEIYNLTVDPKVGFLDLDIIVDEAFAEEMQVATNGVYYIPKRVARGEKKGNSTYTRRENITLYWLLPHSLNNQLQATELTKTEETVTTN